MKKAITAGIVLLMLVFMVTASASTTGTATNPLITRNYLEGPFAAALRADISQAFDSATMKAMGRMDELYAQYVGFDYVPGFTRISLMGEDTVVLTMGGSFVLLSGEATVTLVSGSLIDISTGIEVAADVLLEHDHRYFCAEDTTAVITAYSTSVGQVDGYFHSRNGLLYRPHSVFQDVMEDDWYYPAVDFVYTNNLFSGTAQDAFSPSTPMTRGMFVTVLYRLEGMPSVGSGGQFADVGNPSMYYYNAVTWANANNIVQGHSNGSFGPDDPVTREQMATIIHRYAEYKRSDMSVIVSGYESFPDRVEVSEYAIAAMRWAVYKGIINGSDGMLLPRNTASRAQVAQIISNYINMTG